jgi:hypothetical protein
MDFAFILVVTLLFLWSYYSGMRVGRKSGYRDAVKDVLDTGKFRNIDEV